MSQALHASNLGADALAFVAAGATATPAVRPESEPAEASLWGEGRNPTPAMAPVVPSFVSSPLLVERRAPVSVTVRLPAELPPALLRVAMERKLRGERPFTQQDIVAQAVREWLERNAGPGR
jgi:hypothetical protein